MAQRPLNLPWPYINAGHHLAQGLVFAGLGPHPGGLRYHDCSLYKNDGTLTNMDPPTDWVWVPELGRFGLDFDGVDDRIQKTSPSGLPQNNYAMSAWFKANTVTGTPSLIGMGDHNVADQLLTFSSSKLAFISYRTGGADSGTANTIVSTDIWHFATMVRNEADITIYLDGALDGTFSVGNPNADYGTTPTMDIGSRGTIVNRYFNGTIADAMIWNRALSAAEIARIADPGNAMYDGMLLDTRRRRFPQVGGRAKMRRLPVRYGPKLVEVG